MQIWYNKILVEIANPYLSAPELDDTACKGKDLTLFFPDDDRGYSGGQVEAAKALCRSCVNVIRCLRGAAAKKEPVGIWCGEIFEHGRIMDPENKEGSLIEPLELVTQP